MPDEKQKPSVAPVSEPTKPAALSPELPLTEVSADELAAPLAENMPEPTPGASAPAGTVESPPVTAGATQAPVSAPKIESALKDAAGNSWDPARYKSVEGNPGTPRTDKKGLFIPLNKGRPAGSASSTPEVKSVMPSTDGRQTGTPPPAESKASVPIAGNGEKTPDKYDHAAEMYFNMLCPMACGIVSDEFLPGFSYNEKGEPFIDAKIRDMEKQSITIPLAAYMRVNGKDELSPGWALTLASVGYIGRRAQMPETQKKAKSWYASIKSMFGGK